MGQIDGDYHHRCAVASQVNSFVMIFGLDQDETGGRWNLCPEAQDGSQQPWLWDLTETNVLVNVNCYSSQICILDSSFMTTYTKGKAVSRKQIKHVL